MKPDLDNEQNYYKSSSKTDVSSPNSIIEWIDYRLPFLSFLKHLKNYRVPKNLNYLWNLGFIAGVALLIQIITGIVLAMHYTPHIDYAFNSIQHIMRNVNYGWLIRYTHVVGASIFFLVVYIHIAKAIYYGSYKYPRELLWHLGLIIFLVMIVTAFTGYILPWGQMSYWAATVIINLFSTIPIFGKKIIMWVCGGYTVGNPTLNRFFALHYLLPFIILLVILLHLIALHTHGSNNPKGIKPKSANETIPLHPYYTYKDFVVLGVYFLIFTFFIFYQPNFFSHSENYIPANPLVTPSHIVPEWYFLPFYTILRSVPSKLGGIILMFSSIFILFFLPWLDRSPIYSSRYRPIFKIAYWLLICDFFLLIYIGISPMEEPYLTIGKLATFYYFFHFLILTPLIAKYEKPLPLPTHI